MPLYIDEQSARSALDMAAVVGALRAAFLAQSKGEATNVPRVRSPLLGRSLNVTAAGDATTGRYALKAYGAGAYHILLYSKTEGLLAIMEADWLGRFRTGAATGLASEILTPPTAGEVGMIGAGRQAQAQLLALRSVGRLRRARVFARDQRKLVDFCREAESVVHCEIRPAESPKEAVHDAQIVVTATNSAEPVLRRAWIAAGAHVNAMGANSASRQELDLEIVRAAAVLVVDDLAQARKEAAEFIRLDAQESFDWGRVAPLCEIVRNGAPRRGAEEISVFKSLGAGLEDLAIASLLYDRLKPQSSKAASLD